MPAPPGRPGRRQMDDARAREGLEHLQAGALELIAAARALLDVAERVLRDPGTVAAVASALAAAARAVAGGPASRTSAAGDGNGTGDGNGSAGAGADGTGDREHDHDGDRRRAGDGRDRSATVQRIQVS